MKIEKKVIAFCVLSLVVVSFLSVQVVSAGWFGDFFNKVFDRDNLISGEVIYQSGNNYLFNTVLGAGGRYYHVVAFQESSVSVCSELSSIINPSGYSCFHGTVDLTNAGQGIRTGSFIYKDVTDCGGSYYFNKDLDTEFAWLPTSTYSCFGNLEMNIMYFNSATPCGILYSFKQARDCSSLGGTCSASTGRCVNICTPESNSAFCARLGKKCGSVTANDNCGISRTINCGGCGFPNTCGGGGTPNVCGCTPSTTSFTPAIDKFCGVMIVKDTCSQNVQKTGTLVCDAGYSCIGNDCVKDNPILPSCYDSDGGENYWEKGNVSFLGGSYITTDSCQFDGIGLLEAYCVNSSVANHKMYNCSYGCVDGACVNYSNEENSSILDCSSAVNLIKNPTSINIDDLKWEVYYNYSHYMGSEYYAGWSYVQPDYSSQNHYIHTSVSILNDSDAVKDRLNSALEEGICRQTRVYTNSELDEYQVVYLCKNIWRIAEESQGVAQGNTWSYQNDVVALWFNGEMLFNMEFSLNDYYNCYDSESCQQMEQWNHQRQQEDLIRFVDKLVDNQNQWTSPGSLDWMSEQFIKYFLMICPSKLDESEYQGSWSCRLEPTLCPPHGEQKQICSRYSFELEGEEIRETTISCNPGICSGCYAPKWFGYSRNVKCIPYMSRFSHQTGWTIEDVFINDTDSEGLTVEDTNFNDDIDLVVLENNTAILSLEVAQGDYRNITLQQGETYDWDEFVGDSNNGLQYEIFVTEVFFDSVNYNDSYIMLNFSVSGFVEQQVEETINAYCDIDGKIKQQKTQAWGECQNNFECESNLCSYGECVDLKGITQEIQGFKHLGVRVLCRLGSIFGLTDYSQCIQNNVVINSSVMD